MVSTFTPNIQLEEPARNDDVGVWDTPVNSNMSLIDLVAGGITTISLNNSPVVLSAAQFKARQITFNSTLTGNVQITFPTSFTKSYEIRHLCTGSSNFVIQLLTSAAGGQIIACAPGEVIDVVNDGTNLFFKNLGRVGSLCDYVGTQVPNWVGSCTIQPYLNCDATTFSSATYPALATILGGTTLPDIRGTARYTLNQGTARLTAASGGLDGNTNFSIKTTPTVTIGTSNLPAYTPSGNLAIVATVPIASPTAYNNTFTGGVQQIEQATGSTPVNFSVATFTGAAQGGVSNPLPAIGTGTVVGITMIRAG